MIKQAIIPLAGLGTRLLPLTSVFAKELLPINGRPGIEYILDECIDAGIKEIVFIISSKKLNKRNYLIDGVGEKPSLKKAPSNNAVIGRYILPRTIFKKIKSLKPGKGKEIHITDAIQLLINDKEKFIAHNFEGKYLDCGTMSGYINSSKEIGKI